MGGVGGFTFETDSTFDIAKHLLPPMKAEACEVFERELGKYLIKISK